MSVYSFVVWVNELALILCRILCIAVVNEKEPENQCLRDREGRSKTERTVRAS